MLNKQGPGKIDWTDWTWNPVSGCLHECHYCYMRRQTERFGSDVMFPTFKPSFIERFSRVRKVKPGDKVFVGSSGDLWGSWVPDSWIMSVLDAVRSRPEFIYQFLTKNPGRYADFDLHHMTQCWFGTTDDGTGRTRSNIEDLTLATGSYCDINRFVSFEPLLAPVAPNLSLIDWIIIGADSTRGVKKPPQEWADRLIAEARDRNIPVWIKDNYGYPVMIKEWPQRLRDRYGRQETTR